MNLQEQIRKLLNEETEGIDSFIDEIDSKFKLSEELKESLHKFISDSDCKNIEFSQFRMGVLGLALHDRVLINKQALNSNLEHLLFIVLHEIAHQYQFKKYGEDKMYECYIGEISIEEASEFMKKTEEVADKYASLKIRELQRKDLINKGYVPPQMYKNVPINQIKMMVQNYRQQMKNKDINSPQKISEFLYNMVKGNL